MTLVLGGSTSLPLRMTSSAFQFEERVQVVSVPAWLREFFALILRSGVLGGLGIASFSFRTAVTGVAPVCGKWRCCHKLPTRGTGDNVLIICGPRLDVQLVHNLKHTHKHTSTHTVSRCAPDMLAAILQTWN